MKKLLMVICTLAVVACSSGEEKVTIENLAPDKTDIAVTIVVEEKISE